MRKAEAESEYPKAIKNGSVVVKVYRVKHPTTASGFVFAVSYVTARGRKMQQFAAEEDALEEARLKAAQMSEGRLDAVEMTRADREDLMMARELCGSVPLRMALQEWRHAHELTNGQILPAAKAWAAKTTADFTRIDMAKAIDAFIAAKEKPENRENAPSGQRLLRSKPSSKSATSIRPPSPSSRPTWSAMTMRSPATIFGNAPSRCAAGHRSTPTSPAARPWRSRSPNARPRKRRRSAF